MPFVGASVRRFEDSRLLRGQATFIEDLDLPRQLHVAFVRSEYPHARLSSVDLEPARRTSGVVAAFEGLELGPRRIHATVTHPALRQCGQPILADGRVRYVGEPIAAVVAETRASAQDGVAAVLVDYTPLQSVADAQAAVEFSAPVLQPDLGDNLVGTFEVTVGDPEAAFASADRIVKGRFYVQRYTGMPLETRGVAAAWDAGREHLTLWSSTQWPHTLRGSLSVLLGMPEHTIRVIAPDVGGGFGVKQDVYPEEVVLALLARRLGRPVKWSETRREHLCTAVHAREQWHTMELAVRNDGTILAMCVDVLCDQGAYTRSLGLLCPSLTAAGLPGPYRFHAYHCRVRVALTNKAPAAAYRGAGQPEAVFATERIVDRLAQELGLDPAEVRRKNFIRPDEFPWEVGTESAQTPVVYDSGDYAAGLARALDLSDYSAWRDKQRVERARGDSGRLLGIGLGAYVMLTGLGPHESSLLRVDPSGKVSLVTGASPHGQGTATALAQVVADELGVSPSDVRVSHGDTEAIPFGVGTYASRNAVVAGNAALVSARQVKDKAMALAAQLLEADPADLEFVDAGVQVRGASGRRIALGQLASAAAPGRQLPDGMTPGLEATHYFLAPRATFASGLHVAVVEVDRDTLEVKILEYAVVSDAGPLINPLIVEGQIVGGVAQGIGGALFEELAYDRQSNFMSQSLLDYCMPSAAQIPSIRIAHLHTPSPLNPLGVKGLGEGGAMAPPAAIANAVEDALGHLGVRIDSTPITPTRLAALLQQ
ncbi:MAG: xanthine dehydrogenase family protein molybdopterin-binding subunit [Chloroflexota bacterium]|nr:xanthine dehydrogenase family protein molybdopterin-binding subunit [Chloroflexota bacterium]